jgi:biotin carboxylase
MLESDRDATVILIDNRREDPDFAERATSRASILHVRKPRRAPEWRSHRFPVCEFVLDYPERLGQLTAAIEAFVGNEPIAAVISQTDPGLVVAQRLSRQFCPNRPDDLDAAETLMDKSRMRALMAKSGFSSLGARVGSDENDLLAFLREYEDAIVKPLDGSGSSGVVRVRTVSDARAALAVQRALKNERFLMEEYVEGPEYSVESFTFDGVHRVIAVTEKRTLEGCFVEIAHVVPAPLTSDQLRTIDAHTVAFLDLVGLRNGPAHTELRLTPRGPRIMESHNRIGGGRINLLVKTVYGIDLMDLTFDWALGRTAPLGAIPQARGAAAIRFFLPPPGILRKIAGLEALDAAPHVLDWQLEPKVGDRIRLPISSSRRSGFVVASGSTAAEALSNADEARDLVELDIETVPRPAPPFAIASPSSARDRLLRASPTL